MKQILDYSTKCWTPFVHNTTEEMFPYTLMDGTNRTKKDKKNKNVSLEI